MSGGDRLAVAPPTLVGAARIRVYTDFMVQCSIFRWIRSVCQQLRLKSVSSVLVSVWRLAGVCHGAFPLLDHSHGIPSCKNRRAKA
jgi:hypothetical protein